MDRQWCLKHDDDFREIEYKGVKVYVSPTGRIKTYNGAYKKIMEKPYHYDECGYPHVPLYGGANPSVHKLVALAWVENPNNLPEVNHKDFNRDNPWAYNLEWISHHENVLYSRRANRYPDVTGDKNPNYGNRKLSKIYAEDKEYAKEKQSRPLGQNGRAVKCDLFKICKNGEKFVKTFETQVEACIWLCEHNKLPRTNYKFSSYYGIIPKLKQGWHGYILKESVEHIF